MTKDQQPPRAWQRMLSGRRLDLLNPSPEDVAIEDIAHGLARVARWNGQTTGSHAFSVAQHCLVVEEIAAALSPGLSGDARLLALLHDAPEYVVGDLISPFKAAIGLDYKSFEQRLLDTICRRFGLPLPAPPIIAATIKKADRVAAYLEATGLAGFTKDEAVRFFEAPVAMPGPLMARLSDLRPLAPPDAQATFLARFNDLHVAAGGDENLTSQPG